MIKHEIRIKIMALLYVGLPIVAIVTLMSSSARADGAACSAAARLDGLAGGSTDTNQLMTLACQTTSGHSAYYSNGAMATSNGITWYYPDGRLADNPSQ